MYQKLKQHGEIPRHRPSPDPSQSKRKAGDGTPGPTGTKAERRKQCVDQHKEG